MKWGHEFDGPERLLYRVLTWAISDSSPIERWLKAIFMAGGLGGDPGWEMEYVPSDNGSGSYRVWADPEMSGIEPVEVVYSVAAVHHALHELLLAFGEAHPEKVGEINEVLNYYNFWHAQP